MTILLDRVIHYFKTILLCAVNISILDGTVPLRLNFSYCSGYYIKNWDYSSSSSTSTWHDTNFIIYQNASELIAYCVVSRLGAGSQHSQHP